MEPKQLDDFAPLLNLDEEELSALVNRLNKEKDEIKQGNRIYYLSEVLKVNCYSGDFLYKYSYNFGISMIFCRLNQKLYQNIVPIVAMKSFFQHFGVFEKN